MYTHTYTHVYICIYLYIYIFIHILTYTWYNKRAGQTCHLFKKKDKSIATQIHSHLKNSDIVDNFKSDYKAGHSCETALLR